MEDIFSRNIDYGKLQNSTVMITGANGMLASYLIFFLVYLIEEKGMDMEILACVRDPKKAEDCFGEIINRDYFHVKTVDLNREIDFEENVDYIIHAASPASPQLYAVKPVEVAEPNAIGTYHLLNFAAKKHCKGFLFFSTGSIYGLVRNGINVYEDTEGYVDTLDIHSCYNESKRMGENWCKLFSYSKNVPAKIVRIWHTYSPMMDVQNDPRVFSSFMKCLVSGNDIVMMSDGTATRTFCYITDAIAGFLLILLNGEPGEAYNLCNTDECRTIRNLAEIIAGLDPEHKIRVVQKKRDENDTYLENSTYGQKIPQNHKLLSLGWECKVTCADGFARVYAKILEDMRSGSCQKRCSE